ncbi:MAG: isocitrate lyase/phosphoenolpyruvate mutase family protein [bacterium]|nr:isocitrate lyase/phosphoenolpyruvate mutase family protein [bacterium]
MDERTTEVSGLAEELRRLHAGAMLVLPNVWDAASAQVVADEGFAAAATASAAVTAMLGYPDGHGAPWQEMFAANARVARAVSIPVSMDAEGGYGLSPSDLVGQLVAIGVVGCNLEDTDHVGGGLLDAASHAQWLREVREAASQIGVPLVINARVDVFLPTSRIDQGDRLTEAVRRGRLYREAGADCIYPIAVRDRATIASLVKEIDAPINGNTSPELNLQTLADAGVARVSYGPTFYRAGMAEFARAIRSLS